MQCRKKHDKKDLESIFLTEIEIKSEIDDGVNQNDLVLITKRTLNDQKKNVQEVRSEAETRNKILKLEKKNVKDKAFEHIKLIRGEMLIHMTDEQKLLRKMNDENEELKNL